MMRSINAARPNRTARVSPSSRGTVNRYRARFKLGHRRSVVLFCLWCSPTLTYYTSMERHSLHFSAYPWGFLPQPAEGGQTPTPPCCPGQRLRQNMSQNIYDCEMSVWILEVSTRACPEDWGQDILKWHDASTRIWITLPAHARAQHARRRSSCRRAQGKLWKDVRPEVPDGPAITTSLQSGE